MTEIKESWGIKQRKLFQSVRVSGAPPMKLFWKDAEIDPDKVAIAFDREGDEEWWNVRRVEVYGSVLKKDGSKGARHSSNYWTKMSAEMPDWLIDLIKRAWPRND